MRNIPEGGNKIRDSVKLFELLAEASDPKIEIEILQITASFLAKQSSYECRFLCDSGAPALVLKCLHRCKQSGNDCVIVLMCDLLGHLLFKSSDNAAEFFHDHGVELVTLLFVLLGKQNETPSQKALIGFFHRLGSIDISLLSTRNWHILVILLQKLMHVNDIRGLIATMLLSAWTRGGGNKILVARQPNALKRVLDCALATRNLHIRFYLAQLLSNLATEQPNPSTLIKTKGFLKALELFLAVGHGPTKAVTIRTVEMLASDKSTKVLICNHNRSSIIKTISANLEVPDYQTASARAIFRLIERKTASKLINRCPDLIPNLICLSSKKWIEKETTTVAAYSLLRLAKYISASHKAHPITMEALLYLSSSSDETIRVWAALALLEQSKNQTNAFVLIRSPLVIKALVTLANDMKKSIRNLIIQTMLRIASDVANMKVLIFNSELLEAVVNHAIVEIGQGRFANEAIELILAFANLKSTHARLAKQFGLVESLALHGVLPTAGEKLRRQSLQAVSMLAPHL